MSRAVAVVLALFALTIAASAMALDPGARAPELGMRDLQGNQVTIASLRGRVVVVDFWASWCEPCADSMPVYQRLYNQYRERGLTIIGISQDQRVDNARQFASRHRLSFPVVFDEGHAIANRYRPARMPTSFVIDRGGIVRHVHAGYRSGDADRLEREIVALLGQPAR
ncbi:TlpA family protein disulfide reductase [Sandaracinus amylolyticus]|uniref:Thioredoxin family protein n=1 Tax=Sandaracinus amylolyticus TaxID=927083 RepID=A0A0F6SF52_9BACT|nr:TlpA disulfide reductase family protein [Sandaracinus amylolyticus]AKF06339.1 thioredoxin family protein [Sandaracinus amylolyticus]